MLEIRQRNDIEGYSGYLWDNQLDSENVNIVEAYDSEKVIGFCIFEYTNDSVIIYNIGYNNDVNLFDGIIRAVLFKAYLKGINKAIYQIKEIDLLKSLNLAEKDNNSLNSIENVMNGCKNCKNFK